MKRARSDSEQSRSGTSARSVREGSSLPSTTEVRKKDREVVIRKVSEPKRKETRNYDNPREHKK